MRTERLILIAVLLLIAISVVVSQSVDTLSSPAPAPSPARKKRKKPVWWFVLHGFLTWIGFCIFMPLAIICSQALQKRTKSLWFHLHWVLQVLAMVFIVPGFAMSVHLFHEWNKYLHVKMGYAAFIMAAFNFLWGVLRPPKGTFLRTIWYIVHLIVGMVVIPLSWYTVFTGLDLYERKAKHEIDAVRIIYYINVVAMSCLYILAVRWDHIVEQGVKVQAVEKEEKGIEA